MVVTPAVIARRATPGIVDGGEDEERRGGGRLVTRRPHVESRGDPRVRHGGAAAGAGAAAVSTPYVVLDLNGATVRRARRDGEAIFYGDATNEDALRAAGVERAKAVVGVLSDPYAAARAVTAIRSINAVSADHLAHTLQVGS